MIIIHNLLKTLDLQLPMPERTRIKQSIKENWSIRELSIQKETSLFLRLAASKDKDSVLKLAQKGQTIEKSEDIIKPQVL